MKNEEKWSEEDLRMLREQCRVSDVAFQALHDRHKTLEQKLSTVEKERDKAQDEQSILAAEVDWTRKDRDSILGDARNIMNKVNLLKAKIHQLFSNSREVKGIHGQVIGAESHRVEYTGFFKGELMDLFEELRSSENAKRILGEQKHE